MSPERKLKQALDTINDAKTKLRRIRHDEELGHTIRKVIRELEDAESDIERAIRELK